MYMSATASAHSTGLSSLVVSKVLQSLPVTKMIVVYQRSHQDFYSIDSGGSLPKGD
jgi:hypothetical protein